MHGALDVEGRASSVGVDVPGCSVYCCGCSGGESLTVGGGKSGSSSRSWK